MIHNVEMPSVLHCPAQSGRKPTSIPDTTQFARVTQALFGVPCATPEEAYWSGSYNELYLLHLSVPEHLRETVPTKVLARVSRDEKTRSDISIEAEQQWFSSGPVPLSQSPWCMGIARLAITPLTEGADMSSSRWENLSIELKLRSIKDYARIVLELAHLKFDRIGSIYFKKNALPPNCFELGPVSWRKHESTARRKTCEYDRGPFRTSSAWLKAALDDEIAFMGNIPDLARSTYKFKPEEGTGARMRRWRHAKRVIPVFRDRIADVIEDPLDRYGAGPFVLAHMDLNPQNMIFSTEGANAGHIISVIDWEVAMTVPLWTVVCYPSWFERAGPHAIRRDLEETQLFKDTYIRELQKQTRDLLILNVVQNGRAEAKRLFADAAVMPWPMVDFMETWLENHPRKPR
ncbi:hypothetical protein D9758_014186 [Tetrapyrgos nigripes]|uniref:Aminoglycoside phosphotransferase domain-containing protein n=1 Tax=Tetrapyrgos nigripes TaxID=182062 RepID=A0A8H5CM42_9AGAR|nr:hypothetical protein D9758_014186 [Tetrapyrgos nigripes]